MIFDAHVHLPSNSEHTSLGQKKESLLRVMHKNEVSKCLVISDSSLASPIGSMQECAELFKDTDNVYVAGGISPLCDYDNQLVLLERYLDRRLIAGIKLFTGHEAFYLNDTRLRRIFDIAVKYDAPLLFHSGWDNAHYGNAHLAAEVAADYPKMKLVCCHCFYPHTDKSLSLLKYDNVFFDLSSVADNARTSSEISQVIAGLISAAPERVIFGSDFPCCSQKAHIDFVKRLYLEKETESAVFSKNAEKLYVI